MFSFNRLAHLVMHPNSVLISLVWIYSTVWSNILIDCFPNSKTSTSDNSSILQAENDYGQQLEDHDLNRLLVQNRNSDADPCQDFHRYVCGRQAVDPHQEMTDLVDQRILDLLRNRVGSSSIESSNLSRLRRFFQSCESHFESGSSVNPRKLMAPLISLMSLSSCSPSFQVGSSNANDNHDSQSLLDLLHRDMFDLLETDDNFPSSSDCLGVRNVDWIATSLHFAQLGIQYQYFFSIYVYLDPRDRKFRLRMRRKKPKSSRWQQMDYYTSNLINLMPKTMRLGTSGRLKVEAKIAEVIEFRKKLYQNFEADQSDDKDSYKSITLKQLINYAPNTDWVRLFSGLTGKQLNETSDFNVYLHKTGSVILLDKIIAQTKPEVLSNHMLLDIIESMTPLIKISLMPLDRRPCVEITKRKLGLALYVEYVRHFIGPEVRQEVTEMVELMRGELINMIENSLNWLSAKARRRAKEIAENIRVVVGYPDNLLNEREIEKFYGSIPFNEDNFFMNFVSLSKVEIQRTFKQMLSSEATENSLNFYQDLSGPLAHNKLFLGTIHLHPKLLGGFFFNQNRAKEINFGSLGFVIGHEFAHSFDANANNVYINQHKDPILDQETKQIEEMRAECFRRQYAELLVPETNGTIYVDGQKTLMENLADNLGYWISYRTFKRWQSSNANVDYLNKSTSINNNDLTHLNSNQLFWLGGANFHCKSDEKEEVSDKYSPHVHRCNQPLKNLHEFSHDFGCPPGSPMNPSERCMI